MSIEIASIAEQLLMLVQEFHKNRIVLKFLAPQFIVIKQANFYKYMPKLEIVGVETMLIADELMGADKSEQINGVNRIFLAPEYYHVKKK